MAFKLDDLKKVEHSSIPAKPVDPTTPMTAIVKVKKANYTPKHVRVRARISPEILTCEFSAAELASLDADENVVSVSLSQKLQSE